MTPAMLVLAFSIAFAESDRQPLLAAPDGAQDGASVTTAAPAPAVVSIPARVRVDADIDTAAMVEVLLVNESFEDRNVLSVSTTCGCTNLTGVPDVFEAGAIYEVAVEAEAPGTPGAIATHFVIIDFGDEAPPLYVPVDVAANGYIDVEEPEVAHGQSELEIRFSLAASDGRAFAIKRIDDVSKQLEGGSSAVFTDQTIRVPLNADGRAPRSISLETDHPLHPAIWVPVYRLLAEEYGDERASRLVERIELKQAVGPLRLGDVSSEEPAVFEVVFAGFPGEGAALAVSSTTPRLSVELIESERLENGDIRATLKATPGVATRGIAVGSLVASTEHHEARVRLSARLKP